MLVEEHYHNKTEGYMVGESDLYEPFTDDIGRLFRFMQKEYGRCTSKVYVGDGDHVGWAFEKKVMYTDADSKDDRYIQEVWVTLHDSQPKRIIQYDYHVMSHESE